jgi:hypothetical protein
MALDDWRRVNRDKPCPICGKHDYCMVSKDGRVAWCGRSAGDPRAFKSTSSGGWFKLDQPIDPPKAKATEHVVEPITDPTFWLDSARVYRDVLWRDMDAVHVVCKDLGLDPRTVSAMRIGWCGEYSAYSWPMWSAKDTLCGIRLRTRDAQKFAVPGSRNGLFLPHRDPRCFDSRTLWLCEGPTDTAAMHQLTGNAIGRPSATVGDDMIVRFVRRDQPYSVVICADNDDGGVGLAGACVTRDKLLQQTDVEQVIIIRPPNGKDARDWIICDGATAEDLHNAVAQAMHE